MVKRGRGRPPVTDSNGADLLLVHAQEAFAHAGFEGTSLRQIASRAGVDPALVAHHFGSKGELWKAVVRKRVEYLTPSMQQLRFLAADRERPLLQRLEAAFEEIVSVVCDDPFGGLFIARAATERGETHDYFVQLVLVPHFRAFSPLLAQAMRHGLIAKQPVQTLYSILIMGMTMTMSFRDVVGQFGKSYGELPRLRAAMMLFLRSLLRT